MTDEVVPAWFRRTRTVVLVLVVALQAIVLLLLLPFWIAGFLVDGIWKSFQSGRAAFGPFANLMERKNGH